MAVAELTKMGRVASLDDTLTWCCHAREVIDDFAAGLVVLANLPEEARSKRRTNLVLTPW